MSERLPFNKWSKERIRQGRKFCTTRTKSYKDDRVKWIAVLPLGIVRDFLWQVEGADSPEEFVKVWKSIHRGKFEAKRFVYAHFGNFNDEVVK